MKYLKGLVMLNISPLETVETEQEQPEPVVLLSSSPTAWLNEGTTFNLQNLQFIQPPSKDFRGSWPLAYLLEGKFTSYFKDKVVPEKLLPEDVPEEEDEPEEEELAGERKIIPSSRENGKLILIGTSTAVQDNVMGNPPNTLFIQNLLDYLNDREELAVMRSKGLSYNPIEETTPQMKTFIKTFNIAGLPVIVIIVGLVIWLLWISRKKRIQSLFKQNQSKQ